MQRIGTEAINKPGAGLGLEEILTDGEFRLFRDLIYEECGVSIGSDKKRFLESRLRRRMDDLGLKSGYEYYCLVRQGAGRSQEMPVLLDNLMICETSFFRNPLQFDLLREKVLPEVIEKKKKAGSRILRVWSAGCSTGQEPYSVMIAIKELLGEEDGWAVRVFASDLSFTALERAQLGRYRMDQVKGLDTYLLGKYFKQENGHYEIRESVKKGVIFDYHNLKHDNGLRGLDMIFCRNVMIYFDTEEQQRLVNRFANCLVPGGYLFLGHAESLQGLSNRFVMLHKNKGIAYRLAV